MLEEECSESDSEPICRPPPAKRKRNRSKPKKPVARSPGLGDDSDDDMTPEQIDERRYLCQQRMLLAEKQFNQVKVIIRDLKVKELEIKKSMIADRTAPEFLERAKELKGHFKRREEIAKAKRTLSLDSLERRTAGQRHIAQNNQADNISNTQMIEREHKNLEKMNKFEHFHRHMLDAPSSSIPHSTSKAKNPSFNIPIIIYQLREAQIMEDLQFIDKLLDDRN